VSLGKAVNGIASTFEWLLVVTGGSLIRRPKRSLRCLLVEIPWHINEHIPDDIVRFKFVFGFFQQLVIGGYEPRFDSRCGSTSLCPWERHLISRLGPKQSTHCGGPAWRKTCKQNSFCVGVVWHGMHLVAMDGGGWLKTSEYRHMGGEGLKLLKKPSYDIWTFPYALQRLGPAFIRIQSAAWPIGLKRRF